MTRGRLPAGLNAATILAILLLAALKAPPIRAASPAGARAPFAPVLVLDEPAVFTATVPARSELLPALRRQTVRYHAAWARRLKDTPDLRATIVLTPLLVDGWLAWSRGARDREFVLMKRETAKLTSDDAAALAAGLEVPPDLAPEILGAYHRFAAVSSTAAVRDVQTWAALLWLPADVQAREPAAGLIAKGMDFSERDRFTALLPHEEALRDTLATFVDLDREGRVELAASAYGQPRLPLLVQDVAGGIPVARELCARGMALWRRVTGRAAGGASPATAGGLWAPGGEHDAPSLQAALAARPAWILAEGPRADVWYLDVGDAPGRAAPAPELVVTLPRGAASVDSTETVRGMIWSSERDGVASLEVAAPEILALASQKTATMSEALALVSSAPVRKPAAMDMAPEPDGPAAALGDAWRALESYRNGGRALLDRLEAAEVAWAQAAHLAWWTTVDPTRSQRHDEALAAVYRLVGRPDGGGAVRLTGAPPPAAGAPGAAFSLSDPLGDGRGIDLAGFMVAADTDAVQFTWVVEVSMAEVGDSPGRAAAWDVDVYMDLNHRPGSGNRRLLPGRNGFVRDEDAWEFAVTAGSDGTAEVFQAGGGERVRSLGKLPARPGPGGTVTVEVPRGVLRGDPSRWGYAVSARAGGTLSDIMTPPGVSQADVLGAAVEGLAVVVPAVRR